MNFHVMCNEQRQHRVWLQRLMCGYFQRQPSQPLRAPNPSKRIPQTTARPLMVAGTGHVRFDSAVAVIGPASITTSRLL